MEERHCRLMHELMNSLTVVLGECELLLLKSSDEGKERLEIIRERVTHMAEFIRHYECPADYEQPKDGFLDTPFRGTRSRAPQ